MNHAILTQLYNLKGIAKIARDLGVDYGTLWRQVNKISQVQNSLICKLQEKGYIKTTPLTVKVKKNFSQLESARNLIQPFCFNDNDACKSIEIINKFISENQDYITDHHE